MNERIVLCEACGSEGRIYERVTVYERNAAPHDDDVGPCPYCDGTGGEIIATEPIEIEDIAESLVPIDMPLLLALIAESWMAVGLIVGGLS